MRSNSLGYGRGPKSRLAVPTGKTIKSRYLSPITAQALTCSTSTSCLAYFSVCIGRKSLRAPELGWRPSSASSTGMAERSGQRGPWIKARLFISRFPGDEIQELGWKRSRDGNTLMDTLGRILMVEDDPNDVELTLTALEEYNLANEVVVTRDGQEALDYLYCRGEFNTRAGDNPAVMLLDLKLPKINGLEVLQQIRSDERLKMIPVVVLTSSHEEKDMIRSYQLGVNAYVVKPVDFHEFVNAVKELGVFWAVINEPPPGSIKKIP